MQLHQGPPTYVRHLAGGGTKLIEQLACTSGALQWDDLIADEGAGLLDDGVLIGMAIFVLRGGTNVVHPWPDGAFALFLRDRLGMKD